MDEAKEESFQARLATCYAQVEIAHERMDWLESLVSGLVVADKTQPEPTGKALAVLIDVMVPHLVHLNERLEALCQYFSGKDGLARPDCAQPAHNRRSGLPSRI